jgi:predicted transcriptional regulator
MYLDILEVLERCGQVKLTYIMYETNVNCFVLRGFLDFLMKQNLVEKRTVGRQRGVYSITETGKTVLESFRQLKQALPIADDDYNFATMPE